MDLDQETVRQIAVSAGAVGLFIAGVVVVGTTYGDTNTVGSTGGLALVVLIALFIIGMGGAGLWLARQNFDDGGL